MTDNDTYDLDGEGPEITFGPVAAQTIITELGFEINEDGIIVDEAGDPVPTINHSQVSIGELGGFVEGEDEAIIPVKDDFSEIHKIVKSDMGGEEITPHTPDN